MGLKAISISDQRLADTMNWIQSLIYYKKKDIEWGIDTVETHTVEELTEELNAMCYLVKLKIQLINNESFNKPSAELLIKTFNHRLEFMKNEYRSSDSDCLKYRAETIRMCKNYIKILENKESTWYRELPEVV